MSEDLVELFNGIFDSFLEEDLIASPRSSMAFVEETKKFLNFHKLSHVNEKEDLERISLIEMDAKQPIQTISNHSNPNLESSKQSHKDSNTNLETLNEHNDNHQNEHNDSHQRRPKMSMDSTGTDLDREEIESLNGEGSVELLDELTKIKFVFLFFSFLYFKKKQTKND